MQSKEAICRHICTYFSQVQFMGVPSHNYNDFSGKRIEAKKCQTKQIKQQEAIVFALIFLMNVLNVLMFFCSHRNFTGESRLCVLSLTQFSDAHLNLLNEAHTGWEKVIFLMRISSLLRPITYENIFPLEQSPT